MHYCERKCSLYDSNFTSQVCHRSPIQNESILVKVTAWRRTDHKLLPELMMTKFTDAYVCVTTSQCNLPMYQRAINNKKRVQYVTHTPHNPNHTCGQMILPCVHTVVETLSLHQSYVLMTFSRDYDVTIQWNFEEIFITDCTGSCQITHNATCDKSFIKTTTFPLQCNCISCEMQNPLQSLDPLHWRHNGRDSVSNHQPHGCLLTRLFRRRSKKNIKAPRHWPLCGEFTGTGEFPAQMASYAENVSNWWRHHV